VEDDCPGLLTHDGTEGGDRRIVWPHVN